MANSEQRQRTMSVSTVNLNVDDLEVMPREEYRPWYRYEVNASSNSERKRSRSCLITFILVLVIIALLSIAGLVIAIYSLALITRQSGTVTTISSTTQSTSTAGTALICTPSPLTSYQYSTSTPPQCSNYTNNSDQTRNIVYTQSITYCDDTSPFNNNTSVWIRFLDPAGTLIINAPQSPNRCGAVVTGWYAGQYPSAYYTTATSIVCFFDSSNTCAACSSISITNCKTFFVFLLPTTPDCNYRYCTI